MRCRPDQLCKIVRSLAGNEGRLVVTVERFDYVKHGSLHNNAIAAAAGGAAAWFVAPVQPLRCVSPWVEHPRLSMERCVFPDAWLEPVRGDPSAIDTPADVEVLTDGITHA